MVLLHTKRRGQTLRKLKLFCGRILFFFHATLQLAKKESQKGKKSILYFHLLYTCVQFIIPTYHMLTNYRSLSLSLESSHSYQQKLHTWNSGQCPQSVLVAYDFFSLCLMHSLKSAQIQFYLNISLRESNQFFIHQIQPSNPYLSNSVIRM